MRSLSNSRGARLGGILLLGVLCPQALAAQYDHGPATIPTPLVVALMGARGSYMNYSVGTAPAGWPAWLVLPAPAWVMGGTSNTRELVAIFADSTATPLATIQALLEGAGFTHPPAEEREGFQSTDGQNNGYCRDSVQVSVVGLPTQGRVRLASVYYRTGLAWVAQCSRVPTPRRDRTWLTIPKLTPPPGAVGRGWGGGTGADEVHANATITHAVQTLSATADHYGTQLSAAGWTVTSTLANDRIALLTLDAKDRSDRTWHGTLIITASGDSRSMALTMKPEGER